MLSNLLLTLIASVLPYAPDTLTFSTDEDVKKGCTEFIDQAQEDLHAFVRLSAKGSYEQAYQTWSDLLLHYTSLRLELGQTHRFSEKSDLKNSVETEEANLKQAFQQAFLQQSDLLKTFLNNAKHSSELTPQQRLFTRNILQEYQSIYPKQKDKIVAMLKKLSAESTESFSRAKGLAPLKKTDGITTLSVLTANIICFPGNLPYTYGGVSPWKSRIDQLVRKLIDSHADILCLQEVWDLDAMRALCNLLKNDYSVFIYDAGDPAGTIDVEKMGYNSGLFIASKLPLDTVTFNRFPKSIPATSNRGALIATCKAGKTQLAILTTHLQHGNTSEMQQVRKEQLSLCHEYLQSLMANQKQIPSWGIVTGDLNINGFSSEFSESGLNQLFSVPYALNPSSEKATCTNYFVDLVETPIDERSKVAYSYELLDYCIAPSDSKLALSVKQTLIPLYEIDHPTDALSDHQALLSTWSFQSSR